MPKLTNSFQPTPQRVDKVIIGRDRKVVGTIRLTPVALKWKGAGDEIFHSIPLHKFVAWIEAPATKANRVGY